MIDEKDFEEIERRGDVRYRKIEDCEDIMDEQSSEIKSAVSDITSLKINTTAMLTRLNIMIALISGIGALLAPFLIKLFIGG